MKKPRAKKKPNPVAKALPRFRPGIVPKKTAYQRKPKHPAGGEAEEA